MKKFLSFLFIILLFVLVLGIISSMFGLNKNLISSFFDFFSDAPSETKYIEVEDNVFYSRYCTYSSPEYTAVPIASFSDYTSDPENVIVFGRTSNNISTKFSIGLSDLIPGTIYTIDFYIGDALLNEFDMTYLYFRNATTGNYHSFLRNEQYGNVGSLTFLAKSDYFELAFLHLSPSPSEASLPIYSEKVAQNISIDFYKIERS